MEQSQGGCIVSWASEKNWGWRGEQGLTHIGIIAVKRTRIFFKHYRKLLEVSSDMIWSDRWNNILAAMWLVDGRWGAGVKGEGVEVRGEE